MPPAAAAALPMELLLSKEALELSLRVHHEGGMQTLQIGGDRTAAALPMKLLLSKEALKLSLRVHVSAPSSGMQTLQIDTVLLLP